MKTLLIAGSTGLIGDATLRMALDDPRIHRVIALTRRPLGLEHPELVQWQHSDLLMALRSEPVDAVICCLGTTIRNVDGDESKFIHVDKDLVEGVAEWAKQQGVPVMCVVSAIGADAGSSVFYNRVKGEMEDALKALGIPTLHFFQPSILTGPRREVRIGERIGIVLGRLFGPLLPARYKPMPHDVLARALLNATQVTEGGTHTYNDIHTLASGQKLTSRA